MSTESYIQRTLEPVLKEAAGGFPAVVLTGPRQAGKTTLLKHCFEETHRFVTLDLPDVAEAARNDPRDFLNAYPPPVIFDEIQAVPELLPYIKSKIDESRNLAGQYIFSGSQNILLMQNVTETLSGRAAILNLLPLSRREIQEQPDKPFVWEDRLEEKQEQPVAFFDLWETMLLGGYPELNSQPDRDINLWFGSYVRTYLERDVRGLRKIGDLSLFQSFVKMLAARSGHLLELVGLANDLGISVNTVKAWLSVLEASFQIIVLRPYFANVGKRLVKTPKVYFLDTGLLCWLTGHRDAQQAASGPMAGAIFESAVISEVYKSFVHRGLDPRIWFWRTSAKVEIDLLIEAEAGLVPLEIKSSGTPRPSMAAGIKKTVEAFEGKMKPGYVVHTGDESLPLGGGVAGLPFWQL